MSSSSDVLRAFLERPDRHPHTLSFVELQGFLFAVVNAPEVIVPSEWTPAVFGHEEIVFDDFEQASTIQTALIAEYNLVNEFCLSGGPGLPPGCALRDDPMANLEDDAPVRRWARGFVDGHQWLEETWNAYVPLDDVSPDSDDAELSEELGSVLMVLSFFSSRGLAEAFTSETPGADLASLAKTMHEVFPEAIGSYATLGRSIQQAYAEVQTPQRRASPKIGRNDPCSCGSGRKYKRCCGAPN